MHDHQTQFMVGLDVGSTTVKAVVLDAAKDEILWQDYQRHETKQPEKTLEFLKRIETEVGVSKHNTRMFMTGSGGGGIPGTITSSQISDSTSIGRDLLTVQSALLAREVIGAGTSDLTVETVAESVVGGTVVASYDAENGTWSMTLRPTGVAAGTYTSVQVEADGRVTGGSLGSGALDYATALAYGL